MYNLGIYLYLIGVAIASLFKEKVRKMWRGERDAIRVLKEKVDPEARYVWFHAASLGEFEQGRPLMEQLRREHPDYKILLTFFSPSGYEVRKNYEGADIICYLPLDTITNARRFLRAIHPVMAFFIKYEFWYNYLHILKHRNVPVYSVSSIFRPDQIFFKWYGKQYAHVLIPVSTVCYRLRRRLSNCQSWRLSANSKKSSWQVLLGNPMRISLSVISMSIPNGRW